MEALSRRDKRTIGTELDRYGGVGPGFHSLRIALAIGVVCGHTFLVLGERPVFPKPISLLIEDLVPAFFVLSGFLVTGSALRNTLSRFAVNRVARIAPALVIDTALAALVLGPLFTVMSLTNYFSDHEFWGYCLNIFWLMHYHLPGVFQANPDPNAINASLWSLPYEIACYALVTTAIALRPSRRPWVGIALVALVVGAIIFSNAAGISKEDVAGVSWQGLPLGKIFSNFALPSHIGMYLYFLYGALIYLVRHKIIFNKKSAILCIVALLFCAYGIVPEDAALTRTILFGPALAYLTVWIGLTPIPKIPLYHRGDYSYGVYLYGFPLQQSLVALFPEFHNPLLFTLCSVALATAVAMVSWHLVENPIHGLRKGTVTPPTRRRTRRAPA